MSYYPEPKRSDEHTATATPVEKELVEVYQTKDGSFDAIEGPTYDQAQTGRLLRKMDLNIVPFLALLYLWASFVSAAHFGLLILLTDYLSLTELTSEMLGLLAWKTVST
jgi:hypothetical protein